MVAARKKETFWSEPISKVDPRRGAVVPSGASIIGAVKLSNILSISGRRHVPVRQILRFIRDTVEQVEKKESEEK